MPRQHTHVPTKGPMWGYPRCGLGAVGAVLEPFCGHLSPKLDQVSCKLTFEIPPRRTLGGILFPVKTCFASPCVSMHHGVRVREIFTSVGHKNNQISKVDRMVPASSTFAIVPFVFALTQGGSYGQGNGKSS